MVLLQQLQDYVVVMSDCTSYSAYSFLSLHRMAFVIHLATTTTNRTTSPTEDSRNTSTVQPGNTLIVAIMQA